MCGRYATTRSTADLSALFESLDETGGRLPADYNVAPTDPVPVVRMSQQRSGRVVSAARWGLVPHWARDPKVGARMINARAETVATSTAYARSFARRRCLVPADGWYEWLRRPYGKQAYFMTPRDGAVLAFAGLWMVWTFPNSSDRLLTCSVVTTAAIGDLALVHDRMPLVLPPDRWAPWLSGDGRSMNSGLDDLLAAPPEDFLAGLEIRAVGPAVGDVRNDGPALIAPVDAAALTAQTAGRLAGDPAGDPAPVTGDRPGRAPADRGRDRPGSGPGDGSAEADLTLF